MAHSKFKHEKTTSLLRDLAGEFLARESAGPALVTVTHVEVSPTRRDAKVFLSVLPTDFEKPVIGFAERHAGALASFVKTKSKMRVMPRFTFLIDEGEKNRQRIDELLHAEKRDTGE